MVQNRHTFADAAFVVLLEAGEELHYKEIAQRILEQKYFVSRGKTPEQTLRSQISREVNQKGDEARFTQDQGVIQISTYGASLDPSELQEQVKAFAKAQAEGKKTKKATKKAPKAKAKAKASAKAEVQEAPKQEAPKRDAAPAAPAPEASAPGAASDAPAPAPAPKREAAAAPEPSPEAPEVAAAPAPPASEPTEPAPRSDPRFEAVDLGEDSYGASDDSDDLAETFAPQERDPVEHEAPDDDEAAESESLSPGIFLEEDSEQDFLSAGGDLHDMASNQYSDLIEELAPIEVPPHEGGAAEIARIPLGGRSVLIVKVVRRHGEPQIQLVEELESLISGVVGRLVLTLQGKDLAEFRGALQSARKVIDASFLPAEEREKLRTPEVPNY